MTLQRPIYEDLERQLRLKRAGALAKFPVLASQEELDAADRRITPEQLWTGVFVGAIAFWIAFLLFLARYAGWLGEAGKAVAG